MRPGKVLHSRVQPVAVAVVVDLGQVPMAPLRAGRPGLLDSTSVVRNVSQLSYWLILQVYTCTYLCDSSS